jgi:hypothetical protein
MRKFFAELVALHRLEFDYDQGIDFEPYDEFLSAEETTDWLRAWTHDRAVSGDAYRIFGQDGTGGFAAFWLQRKGRPLREQPIVFFGSEGELGVIAGSFDDYLWLLAGGFGPYEAVGGADEKRAPNPAFLQFAERHSTAKRRPARKIVAEARAEFPRFEKDVRALQKT